MKKMSLITLTATLALVCCAFAAETRKIDGGEWQDLSRMSLGREKTRAAFAPFAEGELANTDDLTEIKFKQKEAARYIRFSALSPWNKSQPWASMAEIQPMISDK